DAQRAEIERKLARAVQSALCVVERPDGAALRVALNLLGVGHSFPSGATPNRRLWAEVVAYREGRVIYESGVVDEGEAVANEDPDTWLVRDCLFDEHGSQVSMFWAAAAHESNALAPHTPVIQSFPRDRTT